jgi:hypothetical protein
MNFKTNKMRVKEVNISLEYTRELDLRRILAVLSDLISQGNEMYCGDLKSVVNEEIINRFNFVQYYPDAIHESKESEINGELKLVIKSKIN